jgi:hypothetical protein
MNPVLIDEMGERIDKSVKRAEGLKIAMKELG